MYPVYDLRTEGGRQALANRLLLLGSPSDLSQGFFANPPQEGNVIEPNVEIVVDSGDSLFSALERLMSSTQGGTQDSPIEIFYESASDQIKGNIRSFLERFPWYKFGGNDSKTYYVPSVVSGGLRLVATENEKFIMFVPASLGFKGEGESEWGDAVIPVHFQYLNPEAIAFEPDFPNNGDVDYDFSDFVDSAKVLCTSAGRLSPNAIEGDITANEITFGIIKEENGAAIADVVTGFIYGEETEGIAFHFDYSSNVAYRGENACPSLLADFLANIELDGPRSYPDGIVGDWPDVDWDHPITSDGEDVGLSATKKHFIRVS